MTFRQESDELRGTPILGVGVATVVIAAFGVWVAAELQSCTHDARGGEPFTGNASGDQPAEINQIEMHLFDRNAPEPPAIPAETGIEGYGWVDRDQGIVWMPVDRAIEVYLRQHEEQRKTIEQPTNKNEARP